MQKTARPARHSTAWIVAGVLILGLVLVGATLGAPPGAAATVGVSVAIAAAIIFLWGSFRARSQRRVYESELTAWAASQAVQAERLRVARDLHDVVSHSLGLITLRAAGTRRELESGNQVEPINALLDIEEASRQATIELRRMLGLLRDENTDPAPLRPTARLEDLPALIAEFRRYGLDAQLQLGELGNVMPGVQLAVYAIVRESLANTARHAGPVRVVVVVQRRAEIVTVNVQDGGTADHWTARRGAGRGIIGLQERAENLGGSLVAESTASGFHIMARLPDPESA